MKKDSKPVLAILNTSQELIEVLQIAFEDEGFKTVSYVTVDYKSGEKNIPTLIEKHHPNAIIYDIAIPYEENWKFFKELSQQFQQIPVVLTTTNKDVLEKLVGPTGAFEIVGKPFDLAQIIKAVQSKL